MKRSAEVVVGGNYGDEGKGLVTDKLCELTSADLVVRFNGGAQAGHTVIRDGRRHVFHHLGCGTMQGIPTLLAKDFVVNPVVFHEEFEQLTEYEPKLFTDHRCPVTTPYDMIVNQAVEGWRGPHKHGSCGLGINETVTRNEKSAFSFTVMDIVEPRDYVLTKLEYIRKVYVPARMNELNVPISSEMADLLRNDAIMERYFEDLKKYVCRGTIVHGLAHNFKRVRRVVFEGAQGLALDQESKDFPYVTRSNTGLVNAIEVMKELEVDEYIANYVTRSYLTRHGVGPLPNESSIMSNTMMDGHETNQRNVFQGPLRFAPLDVVALSNRIAVDLSRNGDGPEVVRLFVTHMDRKEQAVAVLLGSQQDSVQPSDMMKYFKDNLWSIDVCGSYGPMAKDVVMT